VVAGKFCGLQTARVGGAAFMRGGGGREWGFVADQCRG
jgi:hypothetical protein